MKDCTQCGKCCTNANFMGNLSATAEDVERWEDAGRHDILEWVSIFTDGDERILSGDLWISPRTGEEVGRCPFVRKVRGQERYECTIYDTRPETCRKYPRGIEHMKSIGCEMLEAGDTDAVVKADARRRDRIYAKEQADAVKRYIAELRPKPVD
jgi:Fe-S-cluster containining protein